VTNESRACPCKWRGGESIRPCTLFFTWKRIGNTVKNVLRLAISVWTRRPDILVITSREHVVVVVVESSPLSAVRGGSTGKQCTIVREDNRLRGRIKCYDAYTLPTRRITFLSLIIFFFLSNTIAMYNNIPFIFLQVSTLNSNGFSLVRPEETTVAGTERRARGVIFCPAPRATRVHDESFYYWYYYYYYSYTSVKGNNLSRHDRNRRRRRRGVGQRPSVTNIFSYCPVPISLGRRFIRSIQLLNVTRIQHAIYVYLYLSARRRVQITNNRHTTQRSLCIAVICIGISFLPTTTTILLTGVEFTF